MVLCKNILISFNSFTILHSNNSLDPHTLSLTHTHTDLWNGGQALQLRFVLVLALLQGCCLQHQVLLLSCVHVMQVLSCHALRSVDGVLDHLFGRDMKTLFAVIIKQSVQLTLVLPLTRTACWSEGRMLREAKGACVHSVLSLQLVVAMVTVVGVV